MALDSNFVRNLIMFKREKEIKETLHSGWDPNMEGGWPIRLAARYGCCSIVETLIKYGANPHMLSDTGASTLQLAVYSGEHWRSDRWSFLLSCCDSSQLADAAAVAIVFNNRAAIQRIFETGRCNAHIPTTLTGKTLEQLAKGYKMNLLSTSASQTVSPGARTIPHSPGSARAHRLGTINSPSTPQSQHPQGNLSPSVAKFFQQTSGQPSLASPRSPRTAPEGSSTANYLD